MWAHLNLSGTALNVNETFKEVRKQIASAGMYFGVIIIDPLYTTVKGTLNSDEVATDWIRNIRELRSDYRCAVIVLHHDGKEQYHEGTPIFKGHNVTFGSVFWQAFYNQNFKLIRKKDVWTLARGKERSDKIIDKIDMVLLGPKPLMYTMLTDETDSTKLMVRNFIWGAAEPVSAKQVMAALDMAQSTVYKVIKKLLDSSTIEERHEPFHKVYRKPIIIERIEHGGTREERILPRVLGRSE
jgi:hypothetical protein